MLPIIKKIRRSEFFKKLKLLSFIDEIYLYGSQATGKAHTTSDIDLAITCPNATTSDWHAVQDIIKSANTVVHIDCVRLDHLIEGSPLQRAIEHEGKLLYRKRESTMTLVDRVAFLGMAIDRLGELVAHQDPAPEYITDALVKRFEITFELFWKTLKHVLAMKGFVVKSPRDVLEKAYTLELIEDNELWIEMLEARNESAHVYDETEADTLAERVDDYYELMRKTYQKIKVLIA